MHVTAGFDPRTRELREVFLRGGGVSGSETDRLLDDLAVLVSLLLQSGWTGPQILARLGTEPNGESASVVGAALRAVLGEADTRDRPAGVRG